MLKAGPVSCLAPAKGEENKLSWLCLPEKFLRQVPNPLKEWQTQRGEVFGSSHSSFKAINICLNFKAAIKLQRVFAQS